MASETIEQSVNHLFAKKYIQELKDTLCKNFGKYLRSYPKCLDSNIHQSIKSFYDENNQIISGTAVSLMKDCDEEGSLSHTYILILFYKEVEYLILGELNTFLKEKMEKNQKAQNFELKIHQEEHIQQLDTDLLLNQLISYLSPLKPLYNTVLNQKRMICRKFFKSGPNGRNAVDPEVVNLTTYDESARLLEQKVSIENCKKDFIELVKLHVSHAYYTDKLRMVIIDEAQTYIESLTNKIETTDRVLYKFKSKVRELQKELETLRGNYEALKINNTDLNTEIKKLRKLLNQAQKERNQAQKAKQQLAKDHLKLKATSKAFQEEKAHSQATENQRLNSKLMKTSDMLQKTSKALEEEQAQHQATSKALERVQARHQTTSKTLERVQAQQQTTLKALTEEQEQHQATSKALERVQAQQQTTLKSLTEEQEQHQATSKTLERVQAQQQTTLKSLTEEQEQHQTTSKALEEAQAQHQKSKAENSVLENENNALMLEIDRLRRQQRNLDEKTTNLDRLPNTNTGTQFPAHNRTTFFANRHIPQQPPTQQAYFTQNFSLDPRHPATYNPNGHPMTFGACPLAQPQDLYCTTQHLLPVMPSVNSCFFTSGAMQHMLFNQQTQPSPFPAVAGPPQGYDPLQNPTI